MSLLDNFTGAVGDLSGHTSDSGHSWTKVTGAGSVDRPIQLDGSGHIYTTVNGAAAIYKSSWTPAGIPLDITLAVTEKTAAGYAGVSFCINLTDTDTGSYYYFRLNGPSTQQWEWAKVVNGSGTVLHQWSGAATDTVSLALRVSAGNNVLTFTQNGTPQAPITDSSSPLAAGAVGVWLDGDGNIAHGEQLDSMTAADPTVTATSFTLTGPTAGPVGSASTVFTVTPNGSTTGTFTPNAQANCTFTPATLALSGTTPKTFTVTRSVAGSSTINGTTTDTLTPPASITYTAKATTTQSYAYAGGAATTATTAQIFNADGTAFGVLTSIGNSNSTGAGVASGMTVPADYVGFIQFAQGNAFQADVLTPQTSGGGGVGGTRIFAGY